LALAGASREKADALLDEQRAVSRKQGLLLDLQFEDAREQHDLHVSHLRFRRFGDYAKAAMEATIALFIALVVAGFAALIWQAQEAFRRRACEGRAGEPRRPHFADPLEIWGEALMRNNRSDLALFKIEEANKYAPPWGAAASEMG
jgi:hypothetical protein